MNEVMRMTEGPKTNLDGLLEDPNRPSQSLEAKEGFWAGYYFVHAWHVSFGSGEGRELSRLARHDWADEWRNLSQMVAATIAHVARPTGAPLAFDEHTKAFWRELSGGDDLLDKGWEFFVGFINAIVDSTVIHPESVRDELEQDTD